MRNSNQMFPVLLLFTLLFFSSEARADNVVITSGSLTVSGPSAGPLFSLAGRGLAVSGGGVDSGNSPLNGTCIQCPAGAQFSNINAFFAGESTLGSGPATVNGVSYSRLFYSGSLSFFGGPFIVPSDSSSLVTITEPFTFSGNLSGCLQNPFINGGCTDQVFSTMLSGQGMSTLLFSSSLDPILGSRLYTFRSVTYTFQPAATVPEPATLLLFGTGLMGVAARYRRRRTKKVT